MEEKVDQVTPTPDGSQDVNLLHMKAWTECFVSQFYINKLCLTTYLLQMAYW